ncbi:MAG: hypothetical protein DRN54_01840 [Thaumarchaeota archaeon]|nr:MAG: hypothetical protein DRN54_01840 [Nitrososphaerota archaeon]
MPSAWNEACRIVGELVVKLGLDEALKVIPVAKVVVLLEEWVDSLTPEQKQVRVLSFSSDPEKRINIPRSKIPEEFKKNPHFRKHFSQIMANYYRHFLWSGRKKTGANPTAIPPDALRIDDGGGFKGKILVTDCSGWGDIATEIGGDFGQWLREWLEEKGAPVVMLEHENVIRPIWEDTLRTEKDIILIAHMGHGNYTTVTGWNLNVLAKVGKYDPELYKGRGGSWLSCEMGRDLLPDFIRNGMAVGDGYAEIYYFYWGGKRPYREDPYSRSFLWTHWATVRYLALSYTYKEAFDKTNDLYQLEARKWAETDPDVAGTLLYDMAIHVLRGDSGFRIRELKRVKTSITLDVNPISETKKDKRVITWILSGKLTAEDGRVMSEMPIDCWVGDVVKTVFTNKNARYLAEIVKEYPLDDVEEDCKAVFGGAIGDRKLYEPCKAEKHVEVPFEKEKTWFEISDVWGEWGGLTPVILHLRGRLMSKSGAVPKAKVWFTMSLDSWFSRTSYTFTSEKGEVEIDAMFWLNPLSYHTWLAWLLGCNASVELWYDGDTARRPCKATAKTRVPPIWKFW